MEKVYKGVRVRSSSTPNRNERLTEHEAFMRSELKARLDAGDKIVSAKVMRPRRRKGTRQFRIWGSLTLEIPVEILIKAKFV